MASFLNSKFQIRTQSSIQDMKEDIHSLQLFVAQLTIESHQNQSIIFKIALRDAFKKKSSYGGKSSFPPLPSPP